MADTNKNNMIPIITKMNAQDPWAKHDFDNLFKGVGDISKVINRVFDEPNIPAISLKNSVLPYNQYVEQIEKDGVTTNVHVFQIACAGYNKENISVTAKDSVLTVTFESPETKVEDGTVENEDGSKTTTIIQHNGLTAKSGKFSWMIKRLQNSTVEKCGIKNGVLTIRVRENPVESGAVTIDIE